MLPYPLPYSTTFDDSIEFVRCIATCVKNDYKPFIDPSKEIKPISFLHIKPKMKRRYRK